MEHKVEHLGVDSSDNLVYVRPEVKIYEMENEGDLMDVASGNPGDYPYAPEWSKSGSDIDNGIYNA